MLVTASATEIKFSCERCGAVWFVNKANATSQTGEGGEIRLQQAIDESPVIRYIHLCKPCLNQFQGWMKRESNGTEVQHHREELSAGIC
jgi:hypothetical protein